MLSKMSKMSKLSRFLLSIISLFSILSIISFAEIFYVNDGSYDDFIDSDWSATGDVFVSTYNFEGDDVLVVNGITGDWELASKNMANKSVSAGTYETIHLSAQFYVNNTGTAEQMHIGWRDTQKAQGYTNGVIIYRQDPSYWNWNDGSAHTQGDIWFNDWTWFNLSYTWATDKGNLTYTNFSQSPVMLFGESKYGKRGAFDDVGYLVMGGNSVYFYVKDICFYSSLSDFNDCYGFGEAVEQPVNITLFQPQNNSLQNSNLLNFTFMFEGINANECIGYFNYTGVLIQFDNITTGTYNESVCYNETSETFNSSKTIGIYRAELGSGSIALDSGIYGNNGTIYGAIYNNSKGGNETGNYTFQFDGINDRIELGNISNYERTDKFSFSYWFKTSTSSVDVMLDKYASSRGWSIYMDSGKITLAFANSGSNFIKKETSNAYNNNTWYHFALSYDGTSQSGGFIFYIDGQTVSTNTITNSLSATTRSSPNVNIGSRQTALYFEGKMDEIAIYNYTLSQTDVESLFNNGLYYHNETCNETEFNQSLNQSENITFDYNFPINTQDKYIEWYVNCSNSTREVSSEIWNFYYDNDFTSPTINVLFPDTTYNETYNFDMFINLTTDEKTDCTVNITEFSPDIDNETYFSFSENTLTNAFYSAYLQCIDLSLHNNSANTTLWFTKDKEYPFILSILPNEDNSTEVVGGIFDFIINLTDNNDLYNFKFNITDNLTGELIYEEMINISGNKYQYTSNVNLSNYTVMTSTAYVCDSHTKEKIKDMEVIKNSNSLRFDKGLRKIIISSDDKDIKKFDTKKDYDRYTFEIEYEKKENNRKFRLKSNENIIYLPESEYKGHFIIGNNCFKETCNWVDFESIGEDGVKNNVVVDRVNNDSYIITISGKNERLKFNSIGELNCHYKDYLFKTVPEPLGYNMQIIGSTGWFNTDILDLNTTSGVLILFFIFIVLVALVIFSEWIRIPVLMIITGLFGIIVGFLLYGIVSAIMGGIIAVLSGLYIFRGVGEALI